MGNTRSTFDRRHFLRGLGATIALPTLPSLSQLATAQETAPIAPHRTAFVYFPNGVNVGRWAPENDGRRYDLSPTLESLSEFRSDFQVLSGFKHDNAEAGKDGAGDHARANATFLTGARARKTGGADIHVGESVDQVIAKQIGRDTKLPSLELSCEDSAKSGTCDSGYSCAYQFNLSWSNANTPMSPISNPRLVFERLFGSPDGKPETAQARIAEKRSVLDFVTEDAMQLGKRMGKNDRRKLAEYLAGVRQIERQIERVEKFGFERGPEMEIPESVPDDYGQHIRLMYDMMVVAFQTDSTRVVSFLLAHDGSNRSFGPIGVPDGHHTISHHDDDPAKLEKIAKIDQFYVEQFGYLLKRLHETQDVDGKSLLHNSTILYGGGISDPNKHDHDNLPILLAGHGGGSLRPGRHVKLKSEKPLSNLYVELIQRAGGSADSFGDSDGRWANI